MIRRKRFSLVSLILLSLLLSTCSKSVVDNRMAESSTVISTLNSNDLVALKQPDFTLRAGEGDNGKLTYISTTIEYTDYYPSYKFDSDAGKDYNNGFVISGTDFNQKLSIWAYTPEEFQEITAKNNLCTGEANLLRKDIPTTYPETKAYTQNIKEGSFYIAFKLDGTQICNYTSSPIDYKYKRIASSMKAFALIKENGQIVAFGHKNYGGSIDRLFDGSCDYKDGKEENCSVYCKYNEDGSLECEKTLKDDEYPVSITSSNRAFVVLSNKGRIYTWNNNKGYDKADHNPYYYSAPHRVATCTEYGFQSINKVIYDTSSPQCENENDKQLCKDILNCTENGELNKDIVAVFSNDYAFVALKKDGSIMSWGDYTYGGDPNALGYHPADSLYTGQSPNTNESKKVVTIVSNSSSFVALKTDGSITTWGGDVAGSSIGKDMCQDDCFTDPEPENTDDIKDCFASGKGSTSEKCVVENGIPLNCRVITETNKTCSEIINYDEDKCCSDIGGSNFIKSQYPKHSIPHLGSETLDASKYQQVIEVIPTSQAFTAITKDGSLVSWGDIKYGGDYSQHYPKNLLNTTKGKFKLHSVVGNNYAFAAIDNEGKLSAWGHPVYGGNLTTHQPSNTVSSKFVKIHPGRQSFVALSDRNVLTSWGDIDQYGTQYDLTNSGALKRLVPAMTNYNFNPKDKNTVRPERFVSTSTASLALLDNGVPIIWGNSIQGGSISALHPKGAFSHIGNTQPNSITQIYSNWEAFVVVKENGTLVSWGNQNNRSSNWVDNVIPKQKPDVRFTGNENEEPKIQKVYATNKAFLALKQDGNFMIWGEEEEGGSFKNLSLANKETSFDTNKPSIK